MRTYQQAYQRECLHCAKHFETGNKASRYCSERCRTDASTARRIRSHEGHWLTVPVTCPICSVEFYRTLKTGPNRKYCTQECFAVARRNYHQKWMGESPNIQSAYNRARVKRHGPDTVWTRCQRRYPDLPTACEAKGCTEARVLEIAHRPEFKRNGGWRTMDKYERHMFWILCPTCHRVLDRGIETPEQMGLS